MKKKISETVADYSKRRRSLLYKAFFFLLALFLFLFLIPIAYFFTGKFITQWFFISCPRTIELILAGISMAIGLLIMLWSTWAQWITGRGGPVPVAPTQKLITTGPYAYCRNPLHFGALFYCFAFGTFLGKV